MENSGDREDPPNPEFRLPEDQDSEHDVHDAHDTLETTENEFTENTPEGAAFGLLKKLGMLEGYMPARQAAKVLGVSQRSIYTYLDTGKLQGVLLGKAIAVTEESVRAFHGRGPGRERQTTPPWRKPPRNNGQFISIISVFMRPGQEKLLAERLEAFRLKGQHLMPGTSQRYMACSQFNPAHVVIVLVWRESVMPTPEIRQRDLQALRIDLSDVLDFTTALDFHGPVLMKAG